MKLDNLPDIDKRFYDPDYVVSMADIAQTTFCKEGYCDTMNDKVLKAVLYLFGLDINRDFYESDLGVASFRSPFTNQVQTGGNIFTGYERTDPAWKKNGYRITQEYLFGSKLNDVIKLVKGE
jgi:hypothetical protein